MNRYQYRDERGEHMHLLDNRPLIGTSRVGSILAKPLTWWASGLAVQTFGCPDPKILTKIKNKKASQDEISAHYSAMKHALRMIHSMTVEQFSALIDKAYRAHQSPLKEKAVAGTDLHAELERFVNNCMALGSVSLTAYDPKIDPFIQWTTENVKRFLWSEGNTFSEKMWTGGISDVGMELHSGKYAILDFKSTKEAYRNQFIQIAGYDLQISESGIVDVNGNHLYSLEQPISEYYIFAFGGTNPKCYPYFDMVGARKAFVNCLELYKFLPQDE